MKRASKQSLARSFSPAPSEDGYQSKLNHIECTHACMHKGTARHGCSLRLRRLALLVGKIDRVPADSDAGKGADHGSTLPPRPPRRRRRRTVAHDDTAGEFGACPKRVGMQVGFEAVLEEEWSCSCSMLVAFHGQWNGKSNARWFGCPFSRCNPMMLIITILIHIVVRRRRAWLAPERTRTHQIPGRACCWNTARSRAMRRSFSLFLLQQSSSSSGSFPLHLQFPHVGSQRMRTAAAAAACTVGRGAIQHFWFSMCPEPAFPGFPIRQSLQQ